MDNLKFYPILLIMYCLISCGQKSETTVQITDVTKVIDVSETIGGYSKYYLLEEENLLYGFNQLSSVLDLYNWEEGTFIKNIPLPDEPEAYEFSWSEVLPLSRDSLLLVDFFGKTLLVNADNELIKSFNLNDYLPEGYEFNFGNNTQNLIYKNGNLIFRIHRINYSPKDKEYFEGNILAKVNFHTFEEAILFGEYPESYAIKNNKFYFNNTKMGMDFDVGSDTEIILSFRNESSFQKASIIGSMWFKAKSNFLNAPTQIDINQNINQIEWMVKEGFYHDLISDPFKECIYRICVFPQDLNDLEGKRNSAATRKFSIQKIDKKYNLLSESVFNSTLAEYSFLGSILSKDGLYLRVLDTNEDELIFKKVSY